MGFWVKKRAKSERPARLMTFKALANICVLGCTWGLGLLQAQGDNIAVAFVFTIINSLQGAFIFLMHCVLNRQVRGGGDPGARGCMGRGQGHSGRGCGSHPQVMEQYRRWFRALRRRAHPPEMPTSEIHVTYVTVRAPGCLGSLWGAGWAPGFLWGAGWTPKHLGPLVATHRRWGPRVAMGEAAWTPGSPPACLGPGKMLGFPVGCWVGTQTSGSCGCHQKEVGARGGMGEAAWTPGSPPRVLGGLAREPLPHFCPNLDLFTPQEGERPQSQSTEGCVWEK